MGLFDNMFGQGLLRFDPQQFRRGIGQSEDFLKELYYGDTGKAFTGLLPSQYQVDASGATADEAQRGGLQAPGLAPPIAAPMNAPAMPVAGVPLPQPRPQIDEAAIPAAAQPTASMAPGYAQSQMPQQVQPRQGPLGGLSDFFGGIAQAMDPAKRPEVKMVTDFLGNQTPVLIDTLNGTMREPQVIGGQSGGTPGGLGISTPQLQASYNTPFVDSGNGRDENFIKSLGPTLGAQVTSALNGDSKLDGRMLQKIQVLAARAEPGWTQQTYNQRLGAYKSFYGGGKDQETARALNQSVGHFRELVDQMGNLPGSQMPLLNWAKNTFNTQFMGKGTANNFEVNAHALAAELSRLFKGANLSDTEIRAWESRLSPNMSEDQQQGAVRTLHGLYKEAFDALEKKRIDGLGPALAGKTAPLLDTHGQQNLAKIEQFGIGKTQGSKPGVTSTGIRWSVQ